MNPDGINFKTASNAKTAKGQSIQDHRTVKNGKDRQRNEKRRRSRAAAYWGILWGIVIALLINGIVFPNVSRTRIIPTDYGTFISKVDSGMVKAVVIEDQEILFQVQEQKTDTVRDVTYRTGAFRPQDTDGTS